MKNFENIISLAAFCFIAGNLRSLNLRTQAFPFDWNITDMKTVITLLNNNFEDFCNAQYLVKKYDNKNIFFDNKKYSLLRFVHDFDENLCNINEVEEKYTRRIERFYEAIKKKTLFIRYIIDEHEYKYILHHYNEINEILKRYNRNNRIIFVINDDIKVNRILNFFKGIKLYSVIKDENDTVAKCPFEKNIYLKQILEGKCQKLV